jgi:hypothetical protein
MNFIQTLAHNDTFKCVVIGVLLIFAVCMFLDSVTKNVLIGISPDMDNTQRHGYAWVVEGNAVVRKSFKADKPYLLTEHNKFQIQNIFNQLHDMGFDTEYLEILVGDKVRVYRPDLTRPVYAAAL